MTDAARSRTKRYLRLSLFVLLVLAIASMLFTRSFAPTPQWERFSLYAALALAAALMAAWPMYAMSPEDRAHFRRTVREAPRWEMIVGFLALPPFLVGMLWMAIAAGLPMAYTKAFGQQAIEPVMVQKLYQTSTRGCRHQLDIDGVDAIIFRYCIHRDAYGELPDGPMPALLDVRRSYFGRTISSIRLAASR